MKYGFLFLILLATFSVRAEQVEESACQAQIITWDSDGHSPYQDHAECIGQLDSAPSGTLQSIQATVSESVGDGVGEATFICADGSWRITQAAHCAD